MSRLEQLLLAMAVAILSGDAAAVSSSRALFLVSASSTAPVAPVSFSYTTTYTETSPTRSDVVVTLTTSIACDIVSETRVSTPDITIEAFTVGTTSSPPENDIWKWSVSKTFDGVYETEHSSSIAISTSKSIAGVLGASDLVFEYRFKAKYAVAGGYVTTDWFKINPVIVVGSNDLQAPSVLVAPTVVMTVIDFWDYKAMIQMYGLELTDPGSSDFCGWKGRVILDTGEVLKGATEFYVGRFGEGVIVSDGALVGGPTRTIQSYIDDGASEATAQILLQDARGNATGWIDIETFTFEDYN
jgi:hypothetical protein